MEKTHEYAFSNTTSLDIYDHFTDICHRGLTSTIATSLKQPLERFARPYLAHLHTVLTPEQRCINNILATASNITCGTDRHAKLKPPTSDLPISTPRSSNTLNSFGHAPSSIAVEKHDPSDVSPLALPAVTRPSNHQPPPCGCWRPMEKKSCHLKYQPHPSLACFSPGCILYS